MKLISRKSVKPIIKYNSGAGAILCNYCSKIIKEHLTRDEIDGKTDLLFCNNICKRKFYKLNENDN